MVEVKKADSWMLERAVTEAVESAWIWVVVKVLIWLVVMPLAAAEEIELIWIVVIPAIWDVLSPATCAEVSVFIWMLLRVLTALVEKAATWMLERAARSAVVSAGI